MGHLFWRNYLKRLMLFLIPIVGLLSIPLGLLFFKFNSTIKQDTVFFEKEKIGAKVLLEIDALLFLIADKKADWNEHSTNILLEKLRTLRVQNPTLSTSLNDFEKQIAKNSKNLDDLMDVRGSILDESNLRLDPDFAPYHLVLLNLQLLPEYIIFKQTSEQTVTTHLEWLTERMGSELRSLTSQLSSNEVRDFYEKNTPLKNLIQTNAQSSAFLKVYNDGVQLLLNVNEQRLSQLQDTYIWTSISTWAIWFLVLILGAIYVYIGLKRETIANNLVIEQSLQNELNLKNILNSMPLGTFKSRIDGSWEFVSKEWCYLTGQNIEASLDKGWKNFIDPTDLDQLMHEFDSAQLRRMGFSLDVRLKTNDNTLVWVHFRVKPIYSEAGNLECFIGTVENRTDKRRIEAVLKISQKIDRYLSSEPNHREILKTTLEIIGRTFDVQFSAFWYLDSNTQTLNLSEFWVSEFSDLNSFIAKSKSLTFEKGQGLPGRVWQTMSPCIIYDIQADENFPRADLARESNLNGAMAFPIIIDNKFLGIIEFFVKYKMILTSNDLQEFSGIANRIGQVLVKKQTESDLLEIRQYNEQQTSALNTFAIVSMTDINGIITYVNENFKKTSGYSREEILGKTHKIISSGIHTKLFYQELWDTLKKGETWKGEVCNKSKDGKLYWLESTIVPFKINGIITHFVSFYSDITERKETEQKLIASAKMSALGEMAGGIAHEINNPLSVISIIAQSIYTSVNSEPPDLAKIEKSATKISTTIKRISKIILGLKTFARDGSRDEFENYALTQLITDTIDVCSDRFKSHGIDLSVVLPPADLMIACRPVQIEQVILNLLNNSFDVISTLENPSIQIRSDIVDDKIQVRVIDSGPGIPPEIQAKLFTPFFTTKGVGKGTGLGLSISIGIISQHKGKLYVDNNFKNTCFVIELPIAQAKNNTLKNENTSTAA